MFSGLENQETKGYDSYQMVEIGDIIGLSGCDRKCLSSNYGSARHRTPDTQLGQVCGRQEPEGVHS